MVMVKHNDAMIALITFAGERVGVDTVMCSFQVSAQNISVVPIRLVWYVQDREGVMGGWLW